MSLSEFTIVDVGLALPPPREPDIADARIPDDIPNIRECNYLTQPFICLGPRSPSDLCESCDLAADAGSSFLESRRGKYGRSR